MEKKAFALLGGMEKTWWYRGRAAAVRTALSKAHPAPARVLDYGAGFGGMGSLLRESGADVYAYEPNEEARVACVARGYAGVFATETEALAEQYDAICLFDVLEHLEDDAGFLARAQSAITPNGVLLFSVPAFPFLWSVHDVEHQHFRRYTRVSFKRLLSHTGYKAIFASYWNMLLFFPAALMRLLGKTGESGLMLPWPLEQLFLTIVCVEAFVMRAIPLPFGTGLVVVARKM